MLKIELKEISDISRCISSYYEMHSYINQLDTSQKDTLNIIHERILNKSDSKYPDHNSYRYWCDINLHVVNQMWGNTSGGWQGIGGAAMTNSYTTIIENLNFNLIFVFYHGKLAYIADMDEKLDKYKSNYKLPGMRDVENKLTILYKKK